MSGPGRTAFRPDRSYARELDAADPLAPLRERFLFPRRPDGRPAIYLCGNSLGLMPRAAREEVEAVLDDWAALGVEGHHEAGSPWFRYHERFREPLARLIGAIPREVVAMNSLTVNLHLMLATFYRGHAGARVLDGRQILIASPGFPSDRYAARSRLELAGYIDDEHDKLVDVRPADGGDLLRTEDIIAALEYNPGEIGVVLLEAVNFLTGQVLDIAAITEAAHRYGARVGLDLAHAVGNLPLRLHDWDVDFAVWCSYKYLNAGPGAVGGCFVHERWCDRTDLPRPAGWWGNDPGTRFRLHLNERFRPVTSADAWQLSNPSILAMAPLAASLPIFEEAGMDALRAKSRKLTGYMERLADGLASDRLEIVTPRDPESRGCQLSIRVKGDARGLKKRLSATGIVADFREPDILRVAPVPLYNSFDDVWTFVQALAGALGIRQEGAPGRERPGEAGS